MMKKLPAIAIALLLLQGASAQLQKGGLFLGGSLGFSSTTNKDLNGNKNSNTGWSFSPQVGKVISNNVVAGLLLTVGGSKRENPQNNSFNTTITTNNYGVGLFVRKYYPVAGKLMLFGEAGLKGSLSSDEGKSAGAVSYKISGVDVGAYINPGVSYPVTKRCWLELSLPNLFSTTYSSSKTTQYSAGQMFSESKSTNFSAGASIGGLQNLLVGLRWIL